MISQQLVNGQAELVRRRRLDGVSVDHVEASPNVVWPVPVVYNSPVEEGINSVTVRHWPSVGVAALRLGAAFEYRLWLVCKWIDEPGRGWLWRSDIYEVLTEKLAVCGLRRVRSLLASGNGLFWTLGDDGRVWLRGLSAVAAGLSLDMVTGRAVLLTNEHLTAVGSDWRAVLFVAWLSGRAAPISQCMIEHITGLSASTQRRYVKRLGVQRHYNIAIGRVWSREVMEEEAWKRGRGMFRFRDRRGKLGRPGQSYVAWHLPNWYETGGFLTTGGKSCRRRANRNLAECGGGAMCDAKLFHLDGKSASRALSGRSGENDVYWRVGKSRSGTGIWLAW